MLPEALLNKTITAWDRLSWPWIRLWCRLNGVTVGAEVHCVGIPIITTQPESVLHVGARVVLCSRSRSTALGVSHPVILRTLVSGARLEIGDDTGISGASICAMEDVVIKSQCLIRANCIVVDTDFHSLAATDRRYGTGPESVKSSPVHIGNNVFLGAGTIVLKGVTIGDNSVLGAGAVVTRNIPENSIAAGNPARVLRQFRNEC